MDEKDFFRGHWPLGQARSSVVGKLGRESRWHLKTQRWLIDRHSSGTLESLL